MKDTLEEHLEKQLDRVDKWLSFAEAKNAALIAFNVALLQFFDFGQILNSCRFYKIVGTIYILGILLSTSAALLSFIPLAKFPNGVLERLESSVRWIKHLIKKPTGGKAENDRNLLFWGSIATFPDAETYLKDVSKKYFKDAELSDIAKDYAIEIRDNSGIANRKYKWFKIALYIDLALVAIFGFFAIIA